MIDPLSLRVGHGFDVHAFEAGDHLCIGGCRIPFERGFRAHSDGDVLLHAICDALLGAASLGDIGQHFPDSDPAYADADSRELLREVVAKLLASGWSVVNVDATVIAQAPKLAPWVVPMREAIAAASGLPVDRVNVKATTSERLGFTGRGEGIAAEAVAMLCRSAVSD
ncbi:2-C-methyl-D-erythritol 2,4-cyclodiphosphate synthase [Guyparkeria hydrothermalis]|uniref:2-C-methyl-D-erythritol 2,4-cyclodiphosphate synthase n=1 Tax=Guyparkeria hydrothermalis TaxID=923 RepID=UPI00202263D5|nr:2-C-methyl-D-erythritol 2,4-cyclodiphosphate synthase [Guyparkeria hydrothermalis]MCL7743641.1 2-C-methyl-D-erythritol 2,4-cyclodiphosphate synthase [Guyparkeria hydrothermalis]